MRPIDKGISPYKKIEEYQDAEPYLSDRIGRYCSFCEMRINHALAVEHKESKKSGGALTEWSNLLLSCVYCNSRKGERIKKGGLEQWLWPDLDNTFLGFTYEGALPKVNEEYLKSISAEAYKRAKAIFRDLALDYNPTNEAESSKRYKDKRWKVRIETLGVAETAKDIWLKCKNSEYKSSQITNIINQARGYGFFSIWMMVFENESEIRNSLIKAFPGTSKQCFDESGNPVRREEGIL